MALKRYHFDLGNSSKGPVGFCAAVWANSPEEATAMLVDALPESVSVEGPHHGTHDSPGIEYIEAYFGYDNIQVSDAVEDFGYDGYDEGDEIKGLEAGGLGG